MTRFWFIVHNAVAHPLLCIEVAADISAAVERRLRIASGWAGRFHDWTAERM